MVKTTVKAHKEPSRTFQALIVGVAMGVFASLAIGLWQEVTILCRVALLVALGSSFCLSWELTKCKENDASDGKGCTSDSPRCAVKQKSSYESENHPTYKQTCSKLFHNFLSSFHNYLIRVLHNVL